MDIKLFGYWRSSATYRVRIALHLKQLNFIYTPVHLVRQDGEQHLAQYKVLNPAELVPVLIDEDGTVLNQSLAIIEYLEEKYPQSMRLLPQALSEKAKVRALALDIACDVQPLANLRVVQYLQHQCQLDQRQQKSWSAHWIHHGFKAIEQRLGSTAGAYCFGDTVTMADLCLVPQVYNALRFSLDLDDYPLIQHVYHNCQQLAGFIAARPENQSDAE